MTGADRSIHVLHVDDEPDFAEVAAEYLEREDDRLAIETMMDPREAFDAIVKDGYDCVVSDHDMPQMTGLDLLQRVREEYPDLPFILFTGKGSEEVASDAISAGVSAYLQKGPDVSQFALLANRITSAVYRYRNRMRAETLHRIRKILRDVNQLLVRARTREEVEAGVCRIISEAEPYRLAWIGELDAENETVVPRASAGEATDYLDEITVTTDESPTAEGPTGRAVRERKLVTIQSIPDDPDYEPWRDASQEHGFRSSAAVPLVHDETLYGVLNVYSQQERIFDEPERELLAELGEDIAHALHRIETEQAGKRFEEAVEQTGHAVYITDPDGTIEYVNPAFERITGYGAQEAVGRTPRILQSGEMDVEYYEALWETLLAGEVWEEEIVNQRRSGKQYVADQTIAPITHDEQITGFVAIQVDVTERKEREREVRQSQRRFEAIFNNPVSFMALLEPDGSVIRVNEEALSFADIDRQSIRGQPFWETPWWSHSQSLQRELRAWIDEARHGELVRFEADHFAQDGEQVTIDGVIHPIYNDEDSVSELLAAGRDISDRVEREEQLERERDRLDAFAGIVSHDLRNPLNVAQGRLELAVEECDSEHLATIGNALDRMESLIGNMLALARAGETVGEKEPTDLADLIDTCWRSVETGAAELVTDTDRIIEADRSGLQQLLENLFWNAIEHGGEQVTITVGDLSDGFYVEDSGPGIPPTNRDRVFDVGYSTSDGSTGLGLSIVMKIVTAHGWSVRVTKGADGGARFGITGVEFCDN